MSKKNGEKGFFEILKSDPQTLQEAKNKTKKTMVLIGIIFGIFVVLFCFLHILLAAIWLVASVLIMLYAYFSFNQKNSRNFCSDCGARFDYERCVAWEVEKVERKTLSTNPNAQNKKQEIQKDVATVNFTCTCEVCGSEKEFTQKHDLKIWYDDGTIKEINLQNAAKQYFKL